MTPGGPSSSVRTTCLVIALGIALAACGSSTPPPGPSAPSSTAPSASPSAASAAGASASAIPSARPSPAASAKVDAARSFLALLMSPGFAAEATITGQLTVDSASFPISGTSAFRGPDNRQSISVAIPGAPQTSESITTGGVSYAKSKGVWLVKPAKPAGAPAGGDLPSAMRSILDVTDVGIETRHGQALHHLEPRDRASIPMSAIGATTSTGDGVVTVDFYVKDDGTPVVMAIEASWTQVNGAATMAASMAVDYTFSNVGGRIAIAPPEEVWATFTSKRFGYSIAYPSDWEAHPSAGKTKPDELLGADSTGVYVNRYATKGATLNQVTSGYLAELKRTSKAKVTSNTSTSVDGLRARRVEWSATFDGTRVWEIDTLVVHGKQAYYIGYATLEKPTATDRTIVENLIASMAFSPKG